MAGQSLKSQAKAGQHLRRQRVIDADWLSSIVAAAAAAIAIAPLRRPFHCHAASPSTSPMPMPMPMPCHAMPCHNEKSDLVAEIAFSSTASALQIFCGSGGRI
jgi:hypothetical protein